MTTAVQDLMSSPAVTCAADALLAEAASLMDDRQIGSVVVTDRDAVVGILTERDLLRASATRADPRTESVRRWMTADPDVLGARRRSRDGLVRPHPPPLPAPAGGRPRRPGRSGVHPGPAGRGPDPAHRRERSPTSHAASRAWWRPRRRSATSGAAEGFYHYRQYAATDLAASRSLEDVWQLLFDGELPDRAAGARFAPGGGRPTGPPRGCRLASCRPSPRWAPRSTSCAPRCRCSGPSSAGGRPTTSTATSCARRPCDCARWSRPS